MHEFLAKEIKKRSAEKGIDIANLERKASLKKGAVRNIILGRSMNPSVFIIQAISKVLECNIHQLLGDFNHIPADRLRDSEEETITETQLFIESFNYVVRKLNSLKEASVSYERLFFIVKEIHQYSLDKELVAVNHKFADWSLKKVLDKSISFN